MSEKGIVDPSIGRDSVHTAKSERGEKTHPLLAEVQGERESQSRSNSANSSNFTNFNTAREQDLKRLTEKGHLPDFGLHHFGVPQDSRRTEPQRTEPHRTESRTTEQRSAESRNTEQQRKDERPADSRRPEFRSTAPRITDSHRTDVPKIDERVEKRPEISSKEKVREFYSSDHRSRDGKPDAMVVIPPNFDASKPVNLVIYNHGWYDTASSSLRNAHLTEQMKNAPANTVLVVPEWQRTPGSSGRGGSDQGNFGKENHVSNLIKDIFNKTPELKDKSLADVKSVGIISHSAGYVPTESELYKNPELAKKVNSVTLLDSLYDRHGFDKWIQQNIGDLAEGKKHFQNVFNQSTAANSESQAKFVADQLARYNGNRGRHPELVDRSSRPLTAEQMRRNPVIFKSTSMPHMEIPKNYVGIVEDGAHR